MTKPLLSGREVVKFLRKKVYVKKPEKYWGIKVVFPSGNRYWFTDKDDTFTLVHEQGNAKPFLTEGSAKRYIAKVTEKFPHLSERFEFEVHEMGLQ